MITSYNILILYDLYSTHTICTYEHLLSFKKFSKHCVYYSHATRGAAPLLDMHQFDVIIIHYSIRLALDWHFSKNYSDSLRQFKGLKILFIQDEYDNTEFTRQQIEKFGFHAVFSCVPERYINQVYPKARFPNTTFLNVLTGYVPINYKSLSKYIKPITSKNITIGYRGRKLPFRYGNLAREKYLIGKEMRAICLENKVPCDIEWEEEKRIYGEAWYEFLGNCKATLGTESGSNIFDENGTLDQVIQNALQKNPRLSYENIYNKFLHEHEKKIQMQQISPRLFEAISVRTLLILFEGEYSKILIPDHHFLALKKDFSNATSILKKLEDNTLVEKITDNAYNEIIASNQYSYQNLIATIDNVLETLLKDVTPKVQYIDWLDFSLTSQKSKFRFIEFVSNYPLTFKKENEYTFIKKSSIKKSRNPLFKLLNRFTPSFIKDPIKRFIIQKLFTKTSKELA